MNIWARNGNFVVMFSPIITHYIFVLRNLGSHMLLLITRHCPSGEKIEDLIPYSLTCKILTYLVSSSSKDTLIKKRLDRAIRISYNKIITFRAHMKIVDICRTIVIGRLYAIFNFIHYVVCIFEARMKYNLYK